MCQPAFRMCVLVVLILFQRCSIILVSMLVFNGISLLRSICLFWIYPVLKNTQKTEPTWMCTILTWITSPDTRQYHSIKIVFNIIYKHIHLRHTKSYLQFRLWGEMFTITTPPKRRIPSYTKGGNPTTSRAKLTNM